MTQPPWERYFVFAQKGETGQSLAIRLSGKAIGSKECSDISDSLKTFLTKNSSLTSASVDLSDNNLTSADVSLLLDVLRSFKVCLRSLRVNRNRICDVGGIKLGKAIAEQSEPLEELYISHNNLSRRGVNEVIREVSNHSAYPFLNRQGVYQPMWLRFESNEVESDWLQEIQQNSRVCMAEDRSLCGPSKCRHIKDKKGVAVHIQGCLDQRVKLGLPPLDSTPVFPDQVENPQKWSCKAGCGKVVVEPTCFEKCMHLICGNCFRTYRESFCAEERARLNDPVAVLTFLPCPECKMPHKREQVTHWENSELRSWKRELPLLKIKCIHNAKIRASSCGEKASLVFTAFGVECHWEGPSLVQYKKHLQNDCPVEKLINEQNQVKTKNNENMWKPVKIKKDDASPKNLEISCLLEEATTPSEHRCQSPTLSKVHALAKEEERRVAHDFEPGFEYSGNCYLKVKSGQTVRVLARTSDDGWVAGILLHKGKEVGLIGWLPASYLDPN